MNFRLRSNEPEDPEFNSKYEKYLSFLKGFRRSEQVDLWSFFLPDFFHDGVIEKLSFSEDLQNISMRISCPNIEKVDKNGVVTYLEPIWFICRFEGVANFELDTFMLDKSNNPLSQKERTVLFLESEINTLTEAIDKYGKIYKDEFLSIIIKTLPVQRSLSIIFRNLKVDTDDPLAFQSLKQDKTKKGLRVRSCNTTNEYIRE